MLPIWQNRNRLSRKKQHFLLKKTLRCKTTWRGNYVWVWKHTINNMQWETLIPILELRNPEKGLALKTTKRLHLSLLLESTEDVFPVSSWCRDSGQKTSCYELICGGGSFKDRILYIGEVSCCDAWMAERIHWWTKSWLELCVLKRLQWPPQPQLLDVVWCSVVQFNFSCSCSRSCIVV